MEQTERNLRRFTARMLRQKAQNLHHEESESAGFLESMDWRDIRILLSNAELFPKLDVEGSRKAFVIQWLKTWSEKSQLFALYFPCVEQAVEPGSSRPRKSIRRLGSRVTDRKSTRLNSSHGYI